jgi:hypothetical protein
MKVKADPAGQHDTFIVIDDAGAEYHRGTLLDCLRWMEKNDGGFMSSSLGAGSVILEPETPAAA